MEKLGVLEAEDPQKTGSADTRRMCPTCGTPLEQEVNVYKCPKCGTSPFETPTPTGPTK